MSYLASRCWCFLQSCCNAREGDVFAMSALHQIFFLRLTVFTHPIWKQPFSEHLVFSIYGSVSLGQTPRRRPEGPSWAMQMAELHFDHPWGFCIRSPACRLGGCFCSCWRAAAALIAVLPSFGWADKGGRSPWNSPAAGCPGWLCLKY